MRFVRKLSKHGEFGTVSIPKTVVDLWNDVDFVEFLFDEQNNVLVLTPFV